MFSNRDPSTSWGTRFSSAVWPGRPVPDLGRRVECGLLRDRGFIEVFHVSPKDGAELDGVVVPVLLGDQIVPGYTTYLEHVVEFGETLWTIADQHYGNGGLYHRLVVANPTTIHNPNLIHPGDVIRVPRA